MSLRCLGIIIFFLLNAASVDAAVSINEVAWMGGSASANHEWIELYNSGEAVTVTDWVLSDGMNLNIALSGSISGGSYAVLERTSEASAPGTAFLIYTGALVNTGATLTLRDSSGGIVDQVAGGENWENIGGDNTTKETAQYTTSGWVTAEATPGAQNKTSGTSNNEKDETIITSTSGGGGGSSSSKKKSINLKNPETKLNLKIEAQSVGYVNQPIPFYVTPTGLDEKAQRTVIYEWNLGDSYQKDGQRVWHSYKYPGEYLVTVFGQKNKNEQTQTHKITILPVNFSLTVSESGDVQIHNDSNYDVDISDYRLKGAREIVFPPRSIILAKATITVSAGRIKKINQDLVVLYDSRNNPLTSTAPVSFVLPSGLADTVSEAAITTSLLPPAKPASTNFGFQKAEAATVALTDVDDLPSESSQVEEVFRDTDVQKSNRWPYLALIGLILLVYSTIFLRPKDESVTEKREN